MITSPFAKILTTKIAAVALTVCATGGVAIAVTAGSADISSSARTGAALHAGGHRALSRHAAPVTRRSRGSASAATNLAFPTGQSTARLCLALAADVHALISGRAATTGQALNPTSLEQALTSPTTARVLASNSAFARLATAAQTPAAVGDLCAVTLRLPAVPSARALLSLPAAVLNNLRAPVAARLPVAVISQLPVTVIAQLPVTVIPNLPVTVIAKLPAPVIAKLPASVIASLPVTVIAQLPASVIASLPVTVIAKLPVPVIAKLPIAVISGLPACVLAKLPPSVLAQLPASVLASLPNSA